MKLKQMIFMKIFMEIKICFSNYPKYSRYFYPVNKKKIGKTKDEVKGKIINEIVKLES